MNIPSIQRRLYLLGKGDISVVSGLLLEGERLNDASLLLEILKSLYANDAIKEGRKHLLELHRRLNEPLRRAVLQMVSGVPLLDVDIQDLLSGDWLYVPPGYFLMGSPDDEPFHSYTEKQRPVQISQGFLMQRTPVTQGEWLKTFDFNPSCGHGEVEYFSLYPVESITWYEAVSFCQNRSQQHRLEPAYSCTALQGELGDEDPSDHNRGFFKMDVVFKGFQSPGYRLPTDAEWEYACRAGTTTPLNGGEPWIPIKHAKNDDLPLRFIKEGVLEKQLESLGWGCESGGGGTQPVAQKNPNGWGLYDMHGNVDEWCWDRIDWDHSFHSELIDPIGPDTGQYRIARGGTAQQSARYCRSATRGGSLPEGRSYYKIGFRMVRTWSLPDDVRSCSDFGRFNKTFDEINRPRGFFQNLLKGNFFAWKKK